MLQRVVDEMIHIWNQQGLDDGSNLTNLVDAESTLQTLVAEAKDSTTFSAFESESDNNMNVD